MNSALLPIQAEGFDLKGELGDPVEGTQWAAQSEKDDVVAHLSQ